MTSETEPETGTETEPAPKHRNGPELRVKITKGAHLTSSIRGFELMSEHGGPLPSFAAGAHIDVEVYLPDGDLVHRSYSIASAPDAEPYRYQIAVLYEEEGTGGSVFMHERAKTGYVLNTIGPKNFFEMVENADHSILIAGGIGITPILSMAYALTAANQSMKMHFAARSEEDMAFRDTVTEVCGDSAQLYFDGGDPSKGIDMPSVLGSPKNGRHVYVCGPKGMIDRVRSEAEKLGWPEDHVHFEVFAKPVAKPDDQPIEVTIKSTGQVFTVPPKTPILDVLLEAGVDTDYDCRTGICASCAVKVLEGEADHRDTVLDKSEREEDKLMCTCVSWAKTPKLVLDH
jgi:ferredoxin-NADP reductase